MSAWWQALEREERAFLLGVVGLTLALVLAVVVLQARWRRPEGYLATNSPDAVVMDYLYAVRRGDAQRAYDLLAPGVYDDAAAFAAQLAPVTDWVRSTRVTLGEVRQEGDRAWVTVRFVSRPVGFRLFDVGGFAFEDVFVLRRVAGAWRIEQLPPPLAPPREAPAIPPPASTPAGGR